jgi:putative Holliday junction resolvase
MQKPKPGRIAGLDFGIARIGVAISDERKIIAMPLSTLKTEKTTELTVEKLAKELEKHQFDNHYLLEEIVIGLPLMMSGKTGFLADEVKHFVEKLKAVVSCPIVTWDERLTSMQAERSLREGTLSRKQRAKKVDVVAAVIILQNYLDFKIREIV